MRRGFFENTLLRIPATFAVPRDRGVFDMLCARPTLALTVLLAIPVAAFADDASDADKIIDAQLQETMVGDQLLELTAFEGSKSLTDEELSGQRAREKLDVHQITINDQDQDGTVNDNVAIGTTNGDNLINGDAYNSATGFFSTVQNTGNNVLIQNSTIVNVTVETPTQ